MANRLHSAAIHLLRKVREVDLQSGLGPARLSALSVLVFGGARTLGELAAAEQVTPPTMTRLVTALEGDGYVRREADPTDGRVVWLHPTARAKRLLQEGRDRRVARVLDVLGPLEAGEWRTLREAVALLERAVGQPAP